MFRFNTTDNWSIAHSHGHAAMELLRTARDHQVEFMSKGDELDNHELVSPTYAKLVSEREFLTRKFLKVAGASIILYQAMMEALINHALETEPLLAGLNPRNFADKWKRSLNQVGRSTTSISTYVADLYRKFRNPLVHPSQVTSTTFDGMSVETIAQSYRHGWDAYRELWDGLGRPHGNDSWEIMCNALDLSEFA